MATGRRSNAICDRCGWRCRYMHKIYVAVKREQRVRYTSTMQTQDEPPAASNTSTPVDAHSALQSERGGAPAASVQVAVEDDNAAAAPPPPQQTATGAGAAPRSEAKPRRLYWLDWCRTQSVWNVVCGHAWWHTLDVTSFERTGDVRAKYEDIGNAGNYANVPGHRDFDGKQYFRNVYTNFNDPSITNATARWREGHNMLEYIV